MHTHTIQGFSFQRATCPEEAHIAKAFYDTQREALGTKQHFLDPRNESYFLELTSSPENQALLLAYDLEQNTRPLCGIALVKREPIVFDHSIQLFKDRAHWQDILTIAQSRGEVGLMGGLVTDPRIRGRRVGHIFAEQAQKQLRTLGVKYAWATVVVDNRHGRPSLEGQGFELVGTSRRWDIEVNQKTTSGVNRFLFVKSLG